jgi:hypothetical protein
MMFFILSPDTHVTTEFYCIKQMHIVWEQKQIGNSKL